MESRKLTKDDLDKVRNIEGFPIADDEDIIALSDAPYYTACPNPFISEFVEENGTAYNEETDDYRCEPLAVDVSEGKYNPTYRMHPYHTKVPHAAIIKYIRHYTKPGDLIFDGFCGTGMTGVAAQLSKKEEWGRVIEEGRKAIICDISPEATFISRAYNDSYNLSEMQQEAERLIAECEKKYSWMYRTQIGTGSEANIDSCVWSDVFICPNCGHEFVFWNEAVDVENGKIPTSFSCKKCGASLKKKDCEHAVEIVFDNICNQNVTMYKQIPVLIGYSGIAKGTKVPDSNDIAVLKKIDEMPLDSFAPMAKIPHGEKTEEAIARGIHYTYQFYYKRALFILGYLWEHGSIRIKGVVSKLLFRMTKRYALTYQSGTWGAGGGPTPGTLYIPSLVKELNIINQFRDAVRDYSNAYERLDKGQVIISTQSSTSVPQIPDASIDYIFTDPPFGSNIMYSELNYIWESWLKVFTNEKEEAIVSQLHGKNLADYQELMTKCFSEDFRMLKPGRWITIEFHNSKNSVWNSIQEAIQVAGFVVADVRVLDKKRDSFNQVKEASQAIKQDLVISAYKPLRKFAKEFSEEIGTEETAWSFVRQHLERIPTVVIRDGKIEVISERQAYLLFDRMVAYHIVNGIPVPLDAAEFFKGLDERFLIRDNMYFLPDQVNEYDTARITTDLEPVQLSFVVTNEKNAISWLYYQLTTPQTYAELQPKFMQEVKSVDRYEAMPELAVLLEESFLQDEKGRWYIPDSTKEGDVAKLREKKLWKDFESYLSGRGKLRSFRSEAIRVGFARLWKEKNYKAIVDMAERLPEQTVQEDPNILMYYDISLSRV